MPCLGCRPSPTSCRNLRSLGVIRALLSRRRAFGREWRSSRISSPGMVLEGVVTNVAAFGAFVDVGVHQDGLVHISAMSNTYVKDPRTIAKPGDVVRVKVSEVDTKRRRIALTMRLDEAPYARPTTIPAEITPTGSNQRLRPAEMRAGRSNPAPASGDAMAEAFRRAGLRSKPPRPQ